MNDDGNQSEDLTQAPRLREGTNALCDCVIPAQEKQFEVKRILLRDECAHVHSKKINYRI